MRKIPPSYYQMQAFRRVAQFAKDISAAYWKMVEDLRKLIPQQRKP